MRPGRGFLLPTADTELLEDVYIILDYWFNPIREEELKHKRGEPYWLPHDHTQTVPQFWADEVFAHGCAKMEITHLRFNRVSIAAVEKFPAEAVKGHHKAVDYDWDAGRKGWEAQKRIRSRIGCPGGPSAWVKKASKSGKRKDKGTKGGGRKA
jgi:hypothetical protein